MKGGKYMAFPKQLKDIVYNLLQEPTLDKMREFLKSQTGEHNSIDFKKQWIDGDKLAKMMLAIANTEGGIIVFGVAENEDGSIQCEGLKQLKDKASISNDVKNYITSDLKYDIYDFSYTTSEYLELEGRHFQMMVIDDIPEHIPFLSKKESTHLKTNEIYVRRGTSCEVANQEELRVIINRRINYVHPLNGEPLQLEEHLNQLKVLYKNISKEKVYYKNGFTDGVASFLTAFVGSITNGERIAEPNPLYPDEEYEEFISRMIIEKKNKIERVLDLY